MLRPYNIDRLFSIWNEYKIILECRDRGKSLEKLKAEIDY